MSIERALKHEAEAAAALVANLRDVLGEDEQATRDAIEGETGLVEAIGAASLRLIETDGYAEAIDKVMKDMRARKERFERQGELIRAAIASAMGTAELRSLELPHATVSITKTAPKAVVLDEASIPSRFWEAQPPKLDKRALLAALKSKEAVPGATLSNGGEALTMRKV